MKRHLLLAITLPFFLAQCQKPAPTSTAPTPATPSPSVTAATAVTDPAEAKNSVLRVNSTLQKWNAVQPWEKSPPTYRRALGAIVNSKNASAVLTTAEMVADAVFLELESIDGKELVTARVATVDYEANLALLVPAEEKGNSIFANTTPLSIAAPPAMNSSLDIVQIEENSQTLITNGILQRVDVASSFLPSQLFLTYQLKASMQSSASSFSVPVFDQGKLAGLLSSYDTEEQLCDVIATALLDRFLKESQKDTYQGFPNLGIAAATTEDQHYRNWLKIPDTAGGIVITKVRKQSAADLAGLLPDDVILAIDGQEIDRRGYYKDSIYGQLYWIQLVRGTKSTGDTLKVSILRDGKPQDISVTLTRQEEDTRLVPNYMFGKAPNFLVKGGMIFQELNRPFLEAFGEEWQSRAPLNFLDALSNPEKYQDKHDRMIVLTAVIPSQATVGYDGLRNLFISKVNGKDIRNMKDLIAAMRHAPLGTISHKIEFLDEKLVIHLDAGMSDIIDASLLKRGLSILSRAN